MRDPSRSSLYRVPATAIASFAVILQACLSLKLATDQGKSWAEGLISFLGFFTVLTNILVCVALTFPLLAQKTRAGRFFATPFAIAGVATSIAFVALSYHFLLRNVWNPQGAQLLADVLLHYVVPAIFVLYWALYSLTGRLHWTDPLWWALYPIAYFVYALVRGSIIGEYPYAFIDVSVIGYRHTIVNALVLLLGFILLGTLFVGLDHTGRRASRR